jgi:hypothetical protein
VACSEAKESDDDAPYPFSDKLTDGHRIVPGEVAAAKDCRDRIRDGRVTDRIH